MAEGGPLTSFLYPGQMSDAHGALVLLAELPIPKHLRRWGYDADRLRDAFKARGLRICTQPTAAAVPCWPPMRGPILECITNAYRIASPPRSTF
jgi:hypothetical protein